MRVYEILFIIAPNTEESDVETLVNQMSDIITNQGATIVKIDRMGRRRLAYQIKKFNEGIYVVITMEGTGAEIAEVERRMRVSDAVVRYLSIRIDEDLKRAEKFKSRRVKKPRSSRPRTSVKSFTPAEPVPVEVNTGAEEEED